MITEVFQRRLRLGKVERQQCIRAGSMDLSQTARVQILALSLPSCVILGKLYTPSMLQFPHLQNRHNVNESISLIELQ